ncbi:hypothetical protein GCM10023116_18360 [Kistimonas scapharcae]|uniref:Flagellar protein FliT n=1 Tax=Kistimonas scapharcae TaxID=1036133 RepID=A0ABP8V3X4_9GAMM
MPQPLSDTKLVQALDAVRDEMMAAWQASDWIALKAIEPRARALAEQGVSGGQPTEAVLGALTALEALYRRILSESDAGKARIREELCNVRDKKAAISSYQNTRAMN